MRCKDWFTHKVPISWTQLLLGRYVSHMDPRGITTVDMETPKHILCINLNAEDLVEKVIGRLDELHMQIYIT